MLSLMQTFKEFGEQAGSQAMTHRASWKNPRVDRRAVRSTAFVGIALLQFACAHIFGAYAAEGSFDDFPFLVHCEVSGVHRAFYLSRIGPDGVAVYLTPDRQAGTITIRGKAEPVGGEWSGSCSGKTLEQLRTSGQAYDLQR